MNIETTEVTLRFLTPAEGKALHKIGTEEYYPEGLYLAKEENPDNFEEIPLEDVPKPEVPEDREVKESEG